MYSVNKCRRFANSVVHTTATLKFAFWSYIGSRCLVEIYRRLGL